MECPRCRASVPEEAAFCAACGHELGGSGDTPDPGDAARTPTGTRPRAEVTERIAVPWSLRTCVECGAANSPSRSRCGSCGHPFGGSVDDLDDALREPVAGDPDPPADDDPRRRWVLTAVLTVAVVGGVALGLLLLTQFGGGGDGPVFDPAAYPDEPQPLEVTGVGATSAASPETGAPAAVDGSRASAWVARQAEDQALVLELAAPAWVAAIEVGFPNPLPEGAAAVGRLQLTGNEGGAALVRLSPAVQRQSARLAEPLLTDRIIIEVVETAASGPPTIGEITLHGHPATDADAALVAEDARSGG